MAVLASAAVSAARLAHNLPTDKGAQTTTGMAHPAAGGQLSGPIGRQPSLAAHEHFLAAQRTNQPNACMARGRLATVGGAQTRFGGAQICVAQ